MKPERSRKLKTILIIAAVVLAAITIMYVVPFALLFYSVVSAKVEVYEDITNYGEYMSFDESVAKWTKWGMDHTTYNGSRRMPYSSCRSRAGTGTAEHPF